MPTNILQAIEDKTKGLIKDAIREMGSALATGPPENAGRFGVAEYLLSESEEYVDASLVALISGKPRASLTLSRWIMEAAFNLLWAVDEPEEIDARLRQLVAEAFRLEAARLEGLSGLRSDKHEAFLQLAAEARQRYIGLTEKGRELPKLAVRVESVRKRAEGLPDLYALYRVCCEAAHPGLALWRRYGPDPQGEIRRRSPTDDTPTAAWTVAASSVHLVGGAYCLANRGGAKALVKWWSEGIAPLLRQL